MKRYAIGLTLLLIAAATAGWLIWRDKASFSAPRHPTSTAAVAQERLAQLPLRFEANCGQTAAPVRFLSRGLRQQLWLTAEEAVLALPVGTPKQSADAAVPAPAVVRIKPLKANPAARLTGLEELPGQSHYLLGSDPQQWRTQVTNYARVKYEAIYPGVDLVWYGSEQQLEYDFIVAPGADPQQIKLQFTGAAKVELDATGDLLLHTAAGILRQHKPLVYQERQGLRQPIAGGYQLDELGQVSFQIGAYDSASTLVIDPVLSYSTYLGGTRDVRFFGLNIGDFPSDIAVDAAGNAYVAGYSIGTDFPTEKPLQAALKTAPDAIIFKLNPAGNALVYATYLGGNAYDAAGGIAVDGAGNVYLTGATESTDFPTVNPLQGTIRKGAGYGDAFIAKLNADGSALIYSTFYGGSGAESGAGIAVDATGNAYVTGATFGSTDLPLEKPLQASYGGGNCSFDNKPIPCPDAFVAKLNPTGSALLYATYLGGNQFDFSTGIAVDPQGQITIAGATSSANFPTRNAVKDTFSGGVCSSVPCTDAFVTKLTADGSALIFSTYLGGAQTVTGLEGLGAVDLATGVAVDNAGNSYLTGFTSTQDFPLRNALRSTNNMGEAFVTKLDPAGALVYSTFLGGSSVENSYHTITSIYAIIGDGYNHCIAADAAGNAYVTGLSNSNDFPLLEPVQDRQRGNGDAFVSKLNPAGALAWSTLLGGGGGDIGLGIAADPAGNVYVAGVTNSTNFPLANALQSTLRGNGDIFVAKLSASTGNPTTATSVSAASYISGALAPESIVAAFGANLATATQAATLPLPTTLAGTTVKVKDSVGIERLAPLFYVSPLQVNYQIPAGTMAGATTITIVSGDGSSALGTVQIAALAPGLFAANQNGRGAAAANIVYVSGTNRRTESNWTCDANGQNCVPRPIDLNSADEVFVELYGTGIRNHSGLANVIVTVGGEAILVTFASAQPNFVGLDQVNIKLPRSLSGRGEVDVVLTVEGKAANPVRIHLR